MWCIFWSKEKNRLYNKPDISDSLSVWHELRSVWYSKTNPDQKRAHVSAVMGAARSRASIEGGEGEGRRDRYSQEREWSHAQLPPVVVNVQEASGGNGKGSGGGRGEWKKWGDGGRAGDVYAIKNAVIEKSDK